MKLPTKTKKKEEKKTNKIQEYLLVFSDMLVDSDRITKNIRKKKTKRHLQIKLKTK